MYKKSVSKITFFFLVLSFFSNFFIVIYGWEFDRVSDVTQVIDGDSFEIRGDEVRLADVSAPEGNQPGGSSATNALKKLIDGKRCISTPMISQVKTNMEDSSLLFISKIGDTQYKNVNKALLNQGVVSETDYTNNEFNPSTWTLFARAIREMWCRCTSFKEF
jgi:endonuclease YncB( thermonuclease family)